MNNYLALLLSVTLLSCGSQKKSGSKDLSEFGKFPLEVPEQNSLMAKWEKKAVLETRLIDDMETDSGWKVTGTGEMSYTNERSKDGKRSLRFRTSLRDEEHYRKNRSEWGLEWLLKTRFGDDYHMSFSVMRIYTHNKTGTIDDVVGVGYDFAPQFAYCLKDIVGSLPVGMDCMSGDIPHLNSVSVCQLVNLII